MPPRPSGTVTFLFTDVEGSTRLLGRLGPSGYAEALAAHGAAVRTACTAHGGWEVDTQGDSFFVAFERARDAVAAAAEAQAALEPGPVRVRMGIHTGEPLLTSAGYAGMDVHRAARIAAAGHGGQVLLSQSTSDLIDGFEIVDLGEHRLKDLTKPERLYQLGHGTFPPVKSLNRSNLPIAANPLVGRTADQLELAALIRRSRLVTITGAGGIGKTRLALQLAADLSDEFPDGVFFVPLASLADPALVLPIVLEALGISDADTEARRVLLVLDNFEHLLAAAPAVAELLTRPTGATLLITSRTPLHLSMEIEYPLDPLPQDTAVELFLDRARTVRRSAEPSATVGEICRRLDGLPLALELAAARLKLLNPPSLLTRLDSRLPLLTRGPTDLPERQRTLEATIAWSYDLLDQDAQHVFARLSVLAGRFDLDAAETVVGADLEALTTLVDASLLRPGGDSRFLMLETIREFARNRLSDEDAVALPSRHAAYYRSLAERAAPHLTGPDAAEWLARLEADQGNLRSALGWYVLEEPHLVPRLTIALWRFWLVRGRFDEGQTSIERALRLEPTPTEHAELLYQLGAIVISRGATARGRAVFEESLERFRAEGLEHGEARSLGALGHVATDRGAWREAIELYQEAAVLFRRIGDRLGLGKVLGDLATVHLRSGSPERALPLAVDSVAIHREFGNHQGEALALATAGYAHLATGDLVRARALLAESTLTAHRLGYLHGLLFSLNGLGAIAFSSGDRRRAAAVFDAARALRLSIGIEHDPDDFLVADARAAVAGDEPAVAGGGDLDLDKAVVLALTV
ncbi:MAG: ATP-binding protein [Gaiellaceae bacterium]